MSFRKMDRVGELNHLAQEIGARPETLDDAGYLLPAGTGPPEVISGGGFTAGFGILNDFDLGSWLRRGNPRFRNWLFFFGNGLSICFNQFRVLHRGRSGSTWYTSILCEALVFL